MTGVMHDLIARLEKATGSDRELDTEIHRWTLWNGDPETWPDETPNYTRSVDAALTLVPEGWFWRAGRTSLFDGWAWVHQTHPDHGEPGRNEFSFMRERDTTPALALCIACLKARASASPVPQPQTTPVGVAGETAMHSKASEQGDEGDRHDG